MAHDRAKDLKPQYDAAKLFVDRALRTRDSLFTPGKPIWSEPTVQDLYDRFIGHPDTSADSFEAKLQKQLAGAPTDTIQLAGELLYVHLLPGNSTGGDRKREVIDTVLGWSAARVPIPAELDKALDKGLAGEGVAFRTYRPFLLQYLLEFVRRWWGLEPAERSRALSDPWVFKDVASSVKVPKSQSQAEILLHLVHPDTFEDIMSRDHKRRISEAFGDLVGCLGRTRRIHRQCPHSRAHRPARSAGIRRRVAGALARRVLGRGGRPHHHGTKQRARPRRPPID